MKKVGVLIVLGLLLFTGCSKPNKTVDEYYRLVDDLKKEDNFTGDKDFEFTLTVLKLTADEVQYRLILDKPKIIMKDIRLLLIHNQKTTDIFPSIGIFDDKISLIPDSSGTKGLVLVGYLPFSGNEGDFIGEFRLFLEYQDDKGDIVKKYYKIQK
ncbi:MAG: hypothetical protein RSB99_00170 [Bacilli bacterium]